MCSASSTAAEGSPPRVRRAGPGRRPAGHRRGVTSARAESGRTEHARHGPPGGHLRACGERPSCQPTSTTAVGSPPRVRRAGLVVGTGLGDQGVTSARAESGRSAQPRSCRRWGHLRACGERLVAESVHEHDQGSPPRVRRAAQQVRPDPVEQGVTSARAESGRPSRRSAPRRWGHLRACGERRRFHRAGGSLLGSPPRVRRAAGELRQPDGARGVTSARAESGAVAVCCASRRWGHLRACGERSDSRRPRSPATGSPPRVRESGSSWSARPRPSAGHPPRVRRAASSRTTTAVPTGVTSARAESGRRRRRSRWSGWGHLRACGERTTKPRDPRLSMGSPPRVRRAGLVSDRHDHTPGVTSARAESGVTRLPPRWWSRGHLRACGERGPSRPSPG